MVFFYIGVVLVFIGLFLYTFQRWLILNISSLYTLEDLFKFRRGSPFFYKLGGYICFILGSFLVILSFLFSDTEVPDVLLSVNNTLAENVFLSTVWDIFLGGGWTVVFLFLAMIFIGMSYRIWLLFMRLRYINSHRYITLEASVPKFSEKGPEVMEQFLNTLIKTYTEPEWTSPDWVDVVFKGAVPMWYSLEIVSIEGEIRFQIGVPVEMKDIVETSFYSAYPDANIEIVYPGKDHMLRIPDKYPHDYFKVWGRELFLKNRDIYPIRTYPDFAEQGNPDSLNGLFEVIGKIDRGEYVGFQILLQPVADTRWRDNVERLISGNKIKDTLKGDVEKKISKNLFKCKMRILYIARYNAYRANQVKTALLSALSQFSSGVNGLKGSKRYYTEIYGPARFLKIFSGIWPFSIMVKKLAGTRATLLVRGYKMRDFSFYIQNSPFILNTEELATLFHMPTKHITSPKIKWLDNTKVEPPANLPLGERI